MNADFKTGNMKNSQERNDPCMGDTLCEKTEIFMTTINDCDKTDCYEFLSNNSIHLDISIKTQTNKRNGICVPDHLQELQANYISQNTGTKVQTPKQEESNDSQFELDSITEEEHFSSSDKKIKLKRTLQVQIERLPKELVDKLLVQYNESVRPRKFSLNENLSKVTTVSSFKNRNYDCDREELQIKPSYVLLKRLSINDSYYSTCQKLSKDTTNHFTNETELQNTLHHPANENNTEGQPQGKLTLRSISTRQIQQHIQEKSCDQDLEDVNNAINNHRILLKKVSVGVTEACEDQLQQEPEGLFKLPCELGPRLCNSNNFRLGKRGRRVSRRDNDTTPISIGLHDKVCSRRTYKKAVITPVTSLVYNNYKANKQHHINNESKKRKHRSRNISVYKANKINPQQRHSSCRYSIDQCEIKNKSPVVDLPTYQAVNSLGLKKSRGRRKLNTINKSHNKPELEMRLPKVQCQTEKLFISRKRKLVQIDFKGKTHQNKHISSNNKENNQITVRTKRRSPQNDHLEQQISAGHDSITESQKMNQFNQLNDSLEETTFSENMDIQQKHSKVQLHTNDQLKNCLDKTAPTENIGTRQINLKTEFDKNDKLLHSAPQCSIPSVNVRDVKQKCQNVFDSCLIIDHQYERKFNEITECKTFYKRRKVNFQPLTLAALALQSFFGRHV